jgi:hypothetical protein
MSTTVSKFLLDQPDLHKKTERARKISRDGSIRDAVLNSNKLGKKMIFLQCIPSPDVSCMYIATEEE